MRLEERNTISFGTSASNDITPTHNLGGWKIKLLPKAYRASLFVLVAAVARLTESVLSRTCRQEA